MKGEIYNFVLFSAIGDGTVANNHKSASAGDHAVFFFKTPLLCKSYADMRAHSEN